MSNLREAAQQALEVLKDHKRSDAYRASIAMHALSTALEQEQAERDATAAELRRLHAEIEEWRTKAAAWIASPEAAQRLEGYRELGRLAEKAETERDALRAELREATAATNDPAVNNLRTLPESIRMLRAQRDELLRTLMAVDTAPSLPGPVRLAIRFAIAKATGETT